MADNHLEIAQMQLALDKTNFNLYYSEPRTFLNTDVTKPVLAALYQWCYFFRDTTPVFSCLPSPREQFENNRIYIPTTLTCFLLLSVDILEIVEPEDFKAFVTKYKTTSYPDVLKAAQEAVDGLTSITGTVPWTNPDDFACISFNEKGLTFFRAMIDDLELKLQLQHNFDLSFKASIEELSIAMNSEILYDEPPMEYRLVQDKELQDPTE